MKKFDILPHTADGKFRAYGKTLEEQFSNALLAMFSFMFKTEKVKPKIKKEIKVKGKDESALLYNWLEEFIILTITDGFATRSVKLRIEKDSEYRILADLVGEDIDIKKHHFKVEIKSPTFHLMEIKQNDQVTMRYLLDL